MMFDLKNPEHLARYRRTIDAVLDHKELKWVRLELENSSMEVVLSGAFHNDKVLIDGIRNLLCSEDVMNYVLFSGYGAMPIVMEYFVDEIEDEDKSLIDDVVAQKKMVYPWDYLDEICGDGRSWWRVWDSGEGERKIIPVEMIVEFG